jgi:glycosyltransferase involved in cell wall biosynthesis
MKLILPIDSEGIDSPYVWPLRYLQQKYFIEKDAKKWFPAGWALLKTAVAWFPKRRAGTIRHLELGDLIVLPSPLAKQRFSRFLLAMKRGDLIGRLRFVPYPAVKEMTHDPRVPKKPIIVAVGRWKTQQKNAPLLLRVLERVLTEQTRYSARILGNGTEFIQELVQRVNPDCRSRIEIMGWTDPKKLPVLYAESQIFLSTSRYESFLIAAGEALCCGCSVVGDARIASLPYFTGLNSGTISCDSSVDNFRDAVMAEVNAWQSGERDPVQISQAWQARLHPDRVAQAFLKLME